MKFQVTDGEKYQKVMQAEISVEEQALPIKFACKRLAEKVNIPGFRKGKAPRSVLESFLGLPAILEEAADDLLSKAYTAGLKETGLEPVSRPEAEAVQVEADKPMIFKYTVTVRPEVKLGQYKGLPVTRKLVEVIDTDIDHELEQQRMRMRRLVTVEQPAEKGNVVNIDFKGYKDGVPFPGGEAEKYPLELGSNAFIPGFEDQLVGASAGEEREINLTFPEDYQEKTLAGQPAVFKVKVNEVRKYELPELNEDFVQSVSETAENMDQLREEIRERLNKQSQAMAEDQARSDAVMAAVENVEVDIPPVMVENQIDAMVEDMSNRLTQQGLSMEQFLEYSQGTMEKLRENYREQAALLVKRDLMMEEIVKAENFQVTPEDINNELQSIASAYYMPLDKVREIMTKNDRMADVEESIKLQKAAELIFSEAVITDEKVDRDAVLQEAQAKAEAQAAERAEAAEIVVDDTPESGETVEAEAKDAE